MIRIGDTVRFLNSVGGGVVVGFQNKNIALVQDEDGFEIPVSINECVFIKTENSSNPSSKSIPSDSLEFSLSYTPDCQVYGINDSNYSLFLCYMVKNKDGEYQVIFSGTISPLSNNRIFDIDYKKIPDCSRKHLVRIIPFKQHNSFKIKPITEVELNIEPRLFMKAPLLIKLISETDDSYSQMEEKLNELSQKDIIKTEDRDTKKKFSVTETSTNEIVEVDLHAGEILETTAGMSNFDILSYQLKIFRETLDKYYGKKLKKRIVFIHGKGNGVLRQELLKELKRKYPRAHAQDASFSQYGFGATMIIF